MRRSQSETLESARRISRRALLLGSAQLAFGGVLAMRMRYLQVDQAEEFQLLAEENRISLRLLPPARGRIFDRNGTVIAENEQTYKITLVPEDAEDVNEVIGKLSQLVELDESDLNRAMDAMKTTASFHPVTLADRVSWNAVSRVSANLPALPGISAEVGQSRIYPQEDLFVHVAGYVAKVRPQNLKRYEDPPAVLSLPDFQFGQIGVESKYEDALRGNAGAKQVEVNARGRIIRELDRREGEAGADIQLTVDSALQDYVHARLGEESASVVVMDL
jgi:penicillin-binding protein 2